MAVPVLSLWLFRFGGNKPENSGCGDSVLLSAASPRDKERESDFESLGMQSKISFKFGNPKMIFHDSKIYYMKGGSVSMVSALSKKTLSRFALYNINSYCIYLLTTL